MTHRQAAKPPRKPPPRDGALSVRPASDVPALSRRNMLAGLAAAVLSGLAACANPPAPAPPLPPLADRSVASLTDLLTVAGLDWLLLLKPDMWLGNVRIRAGLKRLLEDERLDALELTSGINLRTVPELALAAYHPHGEKNSGEKNSGDVIAYAVRHHSDRALVEKRFRDRLTAKARRLVAGHQLVLVDGRIGNAVRALACVGPQVCVFQFGGKPRRGAARIATLYAQDKLRAVKPISQDEATQSALARLDNRALRALLQGPFEGELAKGARGLMASASALCASLSPLNASLVQLQIVLVGDYAGNREEALLLLGAAWGDLAISDLGHLLGLHNTASEVMLDNDASALWLEVTLDQAALIDGLAAATVDDVRTFLR